MKTCPPPLCDSSVFTHPSSEDIHNNCRQILFFWQKLGDMSESHFSSDSDTFPLWRVLSVPGVPRVVQWEGVEPWGSGSGHSWKFPPNKIFANLTGDVMNNSTGRQWLQIERAVRCFCLFLMTISIDQTHELAKANRATMAEQTRTTSRLPYMFLEQSPGSVIVSRTIPMCVFSGLLWSSSISRALELVLCTCAPSYNHTISLLPCLWGHHQETGLTPPEHLSLPIVFCFFNSSPLLLTLQRLLE